jgi:hypothetical protein
MPTVTLHTKVYGNFQLKIIEENLKSTLKGLAVETKICGVTPRGWVQIAVSGEDEKVALLHLADEIGLCPTRSEHVEKFSTLKGRITALNKSNSELYVDIGVFSPNTIDATIPLNHLQAQLVDGRKTALKKIVELFGFCEQLPLTVKILSINKEKSHIEATLSEKQIIQYRSWTKALLDKLTILGASLSEVKLALKIAKCDRDVVSIKPLGLFEHAMTCKLGTDAAGLIPKIGKNLRNATFSIFNPRRILKFLEDYLIS